MRTTLPMGPTNKNMKSQQVAFTFYVDRQRQDMLQTLLTSVSFYKNVHFIRIRSKSLHHWQWVHANHKNNCKVDKKTLNLSLFGSVAYFKRNSPRIFSRIVATVSPGEYRIEIRRNSEHTQQTKKYSPRTHVSKKHKCMHSSVRVSHSLSDSLCIWCLVENTSYILVVNCHHMIAWLDNCRRKLTFRDS